MLLVLGLLVLLQQVFWVSLLWLSIRAARRAGLSVDAALLGSALLLGLLSGLLTVATWQRSDSILAANSVGLLLGEVLYGYFTSLVPAGTPSPHYAIAWPLRTPQIFIWTSTAWVAFLALLLSLFMRYRAGSRKYS
jgi:hypothetical protein